jgi:hypothetical protein
MSFSGKWIELEIVTLSKISQVQEDKYCTFHLHFLKDIKGKGELFGRRKKTARREMGG